MSKNKQQPSFDENAISNDRVEIVSQPLPRVSQGTFTLSVSNDCPLLKVKVSDITHFHYMTSILICMLVQNFSHFSISSESG